MSLRLRVILASLGVAGLVLCQPPPKPEREEDGINNRRDEWFWRQRVFPGNSIPLDARRKAIEQMERMMPKAPVHQPRSFSSASALSTTSWTSIGPQPIGSQSWAGRVYDIAVDPRNSNVVFAGVDDGGVWKTTDGGVNWIPLTDAQQCQSILSMAMSPSNPDVIYAGTGSRYEGCGILKTSDGGNNWTQVTNPVSQGFTGPIYVAVHPSDNRIVLAASQFIYRSADGGATWSIVSTFAGVVKVQFDPSNGSHAWATVLSDGIYQSHDGGLSWAPTNGSGAGALPSGNQYSLGIAPSAPATAYVAIRNSQWTLRGFFKTVDGGASWAQVGSPYLDSIDYWTWTFSVHPTNPNIVFAGLLEIHQSLDGGMTWTDASNFSSYPHVDQHIQAFSADGNKLYIGNDGGVWSTESPTSSRFTWVNLNRTFATALFTPGFAIHPNNANFALGGTQDNGTLSYHGGLNWSISAGGDGGPAAIDFTQPATVYHTYNWPGGVEKSTTAGATWQPASSGLNTADRSSFYNPLVMDPSNSQRLYFGTTNLYQTNNGAASWTPIATNLFAGLGIDAIGVAPSDGNTVYIGSCGFSAHIFRTRNALGNAAWTKVSDSLPDRCVTQIIVHPTNPLMAWAAVSGFSSNTILPGHIFKTADGGDTWTNVTGNLPDMPVNDLVLDPDLPGTLYLATDIGVFRTLNNGLSWAPLGTGLPRTVVTAIRLHRPSRTLRAATWGRSMWDLSVPAAGQVRISITASSVGASFSLEDGSIYTSPATFSWTAGSQHTITWLPSSTQPGARYHFQSWADGGASVRTITTPSTDTSYTATVQLQYELTLSVPSPAWGTLNATPPSADGFYNAGTVVQLVPAPASGFRFWQFSGDFHGNTVPLSVTIDGPHSVAASFLGLCDFVTTLLWTDFYVGPLAGSGLIEWSVGAGCPWVLTNLSPWMTTSGSASGTGSGSVSYSYSQNAGSASLTGEFLLGPTSSSGSQIRINQSGASSPLPSIVSITPNDGGGLSQVFTIKVNVPGGYASLLGSGLTFLDTSGNVGCFFNYTRAVQQWTVSLPGDNSIQQTILVPGPGKLSNSKCQIDGSQFSFTGIGQTASLNMSVTFPASTKGRRVIQAGAWDAANDNTNVLIGHFTVGQVTGFVDSITVGSGNTLNVRGWAADSNGGAPVTRVDVSIDGNLAGSATLGDARPDVAAALGRSDYTNSGWSLQASIKGLVAGTHIVTVTAVGPSGPMLLPGATTFTLGGVIGYLDSIVGINGKTAISKGDLVLISGWAADTVSGAPVTGVSVAVDGVTVGSATLGGSRPDVAKVLGRQDYINSGWLISIGTASLSVGSHSVAATATGSSGFAQLGPATFTISSGGKVVGYVDSATNGAGSSTITQNGTLYLGGWAVDTATGAPVTRVSIAIDGIAVGNATLGGSRPDVANALSRSDYALSGWSYQTSIATLSIGPHTISVNGIGPSGSALLPGANGLTVAATPLGKEVGWVDSVAGGVPLSKGAQLVVGGWAADTLSGAPVTTVTVSIDGAVVGTATLGVKRPDVAAALSRSDYVNSGWAFQSGTSLLPVGAHTLTVAASGPSGVAQLPGASSFTITGAQEIGYVDFVGNGSGSSKVTKGASLFVSGWAADTANGTPVTRVTVSVDGTVVGDATLGGSRSDVVSVLGRSDFLLGGWSFQWSTSALATGVHSVTAMAVGPSGSAQLVGAGNLTIVP